jgi:hypothetical protein
MTNNDGAVGRLLRTVVVHHSPASCSQLHHTVVSCFSDSNSSCTVSSGPTTPVSFDLFFTVFDQMESLKRTGLGDVSVFGNVGCYFES